MHFGLRASLQTRPLCELPNDITKCRTDLLCGCNTQMILQLSALEPLQSHFCLESFKHVDFAHRLRDSAPALSAHVSIHGAG